MCVSHKPCEDAPVFDVFLNWGTGSLSLQLYLFHGIFSSSNVLSGFHRPVYTSSVLKIQPLIHSGVKSIAQIKFLLKFACEFLSLTNVLSTKLKQEGLCASFFKCHGSSNFNHLRWLLLTPAQTLIVTKGMCKSARRIVCYSLFTESV